MTRLTHLVGIAAVALGVASCASTSFQQAPPTNLSEPSAAYQIQAKDVELTRACGSKVSGEGVFTSTVNGFSRFKVNVSQTGIADGSGFAPARGSITFSGPSGRERVPINLIAIDSFFAFRLANSKGTPTITDLITLITDGLGNGNVQWGEFSPSGFTSIVPFADYTGDVLHTQLLPCSP